MPGALNRLNSGRFESEAIVVVKETVHCQVSKSAGLHGVAHVLTVRAWKFEVAWFKGALVSTIPNGRQAGHKTLRDSLSACFRLRALVLDELADRSIRLTHRIAHAGVHLGSYPSNMPAFRQEFILPCQDLIFILHNLFGENRLHAFPPDAARTGRIPARFAFKTPWIWPACTSSPALTRTLTAVYRVELDRSLSWWVWPSG